MGVVVAKSSDGLNFKPVCQIGRADFGAASFERPVIVPTDSGWRLDISRATLTPSTGGSMRLVRSPGDNASHAELKESLPAVSD